VYAYCHWRISLCNEFGSVLAGHKRVCFRLYADLLSAHMKTVGVYCQLSHKTHEYAVWAELAFLNVTLGGTFSDHWASKDLKRSSLQITVIKK